MHDLNKGKGEEDIKLVNMGCFRLQSLVHSMTTC